MPRKRSSGEGSIIKLPDGRFAAKIRVGHDAQGKPIVLKKEAQTEKAVKEWLTDIRHSRQNGANFTSAKMTVGDLLERWLKEVVARRCKPKTITFHESNAKHIRPSALAKMKLEAVKTPHIQEFLNAKRDAGLSAKSVKHLRDDLRAALNIAVDEWDLLQKNPAKKASPGRIEKPEIKVFSPDEARRFLEAVKGHQWEALFTVAMVLGLRRGEALGLRWQDFDQEGSRLRVEKSLDFLDGKWIYGDAKTDESRSTLPILGFAASSLARRRKTQEEEKRKADKRDAWTGNEWGLIFTTRNGTPINPRNLQSTFDRLLKWGALPKIRMHDLRHSAVTILMAQGVPMALISRYIRHANIKTTADQYGHLCADDLGAVTDALDRVFSPVGTVVGTVKVQ